MNKKLGSTLIAMTIIIFMLFLTLGMFTKNFGGTAKADIATAQTNIVKGKLLDVNNDESIDVGNTGGYFFSVKNTDDNGNQTQVKMKYKIIVETVKTDDDGNTLYEGNVNYVLYKAKLDDSGNPVIENENNRITSTPDADGNAEFSTEDMVLNIDAQQVDNYILKFTPENDGQFKFKVKVISEQVD